MLAKLTRLLPFKITTRLVFETAAIGMALLLIQVMVRRAMAGHGLLLTDGNPFFGDFIAFWSAGRVVLEGHADQVWSVTFSRDGRLAASTGQDGTVCAGL